MCIVQRRTKENSLTIFNPLDSIKTDEGLLKRLAESAKTKMTKSEIEAQRWSFIRSGTSSGDGGTTV